MPGFINFRETNESEKRYFTIQTFSEDSAKELGENIKQIVGSENVAVFSEGYYPSVRVRATKEEFDYVCFKHNLGCPETVYFY